MRAMEFTAAAAQNHRSFRKGTTRWSPALTKTTACLFLLLLLSYTVGYLSALLLSSSSSSSSTHIVDTSTIIHHPTTPPPPPPLDPLDHHNIFRTRCAADRPVPPELVRQTIIDKVFNGISPWNNFPPSHVAQLLQPNKLKGWGSNAPVFEHLIRKVQPKVIIELGTFLGASALHMVDLTQDHDTQIICIDDFRGWPGFQQEKKGQRKSFEDIKMVNGDVTLMYQFMQNVVRANATGQVIFMPFSTGAALEKLCEWGIFGDLIEVDAGHDFHSAWVDINRAYKILSRRRPELDGGDNGSGILFGHDYTTAADNKGVQRAVNLFARLHNLRIQVHGRHWILHHTNP